MEIMLELRMKFQYRKRYEVTCDSRWKSGMGGGKWFQYRKRYEVTCDVERELSKA